MTENELARIVDDTAYPIHHRPGPGLLESVYHAILLHELRKRGLHVETTVPIPVVWEEVHLEVGFEAALILENKLVLELKSVAQTAPFTRSSSSPTCG